MIDNCWFLLCWWAFTMILLWTWIFVHLIRHLIRIIRLEMMISDARNNSTREAGA